MASRDWSRLARYVRERRGELGLTQEEVATRGGPSTATLRLIEGGEPGSYRPKSLRQLADGLGWTPNSPLAILNGREPQLAGETSAEPPEPHRFEPAGASPSGTSQEPTALDAHAWELIIAAAAPDMRELNAAIETALAVNPDAKGPDIFADPVLAEIWDMKTPHVTDRLLPMAAYVFGLRQRKRNTDRTA